MPNRVYLALNLLGRIDCQVESNPPLTIILWSKGHEMIDFVMNRHVRVDKYGSLVFSPVRGTDEGQYTCTPYSPLGPGHTSPPVQVYVRGRNRRSVVSYCVCVCVYVCVFTCVSV